MSFAYRTELRKEGKITFEVPKIRASLQEPRKHVRFKAPVFYNPRMELNRDLAVIAAQTYQRIVNRMISVCEPLTGCGVRGVRFAKEIEGVQEVVVNDIRPEAARLAEFNVKKNKVTRIVKVFNGDANLVLAKYAAPRKRFDYVDVDPFGSPAPYADSAVRALRNGGLLALTATDMAPLCGVHPRACVRKYWGKPLRTEYCHELALRLLIGSIVMAAAKHDIGLQVVFSYSTYNHVRTYIAMNYGAKEADATVRRMGYVLHCFECFHRETVARLTSSLMRECPECSSKLQVAGPMWLGDLWDKEFCVKMQSEALKKKPVNTQIMRLISTVLKEMDVPIPYYVIDKLCDKWNLPIPPMSEIIADLKKRGFQVSTSHFSPKAIRTDASAMVLKETIMKLVNHEIRNI